MYYTGFSFTVLISHRQKRFIIPQSARPYSNLGTVMEQLKQSNGKYRKIKNVFFLTLNLKFAEHRLKKINRVIRVWYCDKSILYLKSFTYGLGKSFYVKRESHNLRITLHMESNSAWFNLIFGHRRGGQFWPQNIFHSVNIFHSLFGVFHALSTVAFSSSPSLLYQSAQSASWDQNDWSGILYV